MSTTTASTVVGVFVDRNQSDPAIAGLGRAGFRPDQIRVLTRDPLGRSTAVHRERSPTRAHDGALMGAAVGAVGGVLVGLAVMAGIFPAVGPAISSGALTTVLSYAAGGTVITSLAGAIIGWGIPQGHTPLYVGQFSPGRIVVTVRAGVHGDDARAILRSHGAYDPEAGQPFVAHS